MERWSSFVCKCLFSAILGICLLCADVVNAKVVYVKTTGSDSSSGLTWALAKLTVQAALNTAVSGDEVWVTAGTYVERITLKNGVGLYGGFAGSETDRSQRNWTTNVTTLDGNQGGSTVATPSGATSTTIIDGFTIRNGMASSGGGGIYCNSGTPTISNNIITGNSATYYGGGIYCYINSSPTIIYNTISNNNVTSLFGGGIYCYSGASPNISYNTVTGNSSKYDGGGIYCGVDSSPTIFFNVITNNTGTYGAGISCSSAPAKIFNNRISGNTASSSGGGINCYSSTPTISNNIIISNNASSGAGIYCLNTAATIINNTISGNTGSGSSAAGIYLSGDPVIVNNIISFNASGIYRSSGTPTLRNNDVYGNTSYNYSGISAGPGDISQDPLFVNRSGGDYHLQSSSLCINVGDDSVVQSGSADTDGEARISGAHVDMGADEFMTTSIVALPTFTPDGASFISMQSVTVSCATSGAEIHYTTNGVDPVQTDSLVTGPIVLDSTTTLKAKAWKSGWTASAVKSATFTGKAATPTFSPDGGTFTSAQNVTISCSTTGAQIRYTTNGNDPTESDTLVTGTVQVSTGLTLKAKAFKTGLTSSDVKSGVYVIQVATPYTSPSAGTYIAAQNVTIYCSTSGATIHYTTNGVDPTEADPVFSGTVPVDRSMTIKAKAWKTGWAASNTGSAAYVIKAATPTLNPDAGTYVFPMNVTVACSTAGAEMHYTTNGIDPTLSDTLVTAPITVSSGMTLKVRAWKNPFDVSDIKQAVYTAGKVVYVKPDGSDSASGLTWTLAKKTIQAAINTAVLGDDVYVAAGTYLERITLKDGVRVYGGFAGTETTRDQRNWKTNITVIDGNRQGVVVTSGTLNTMTIIDGFTIQNASGTTVSCSSSKLTISHNIIKDGTGDGVKCTSYGTVTNNIITGNGGYGVYTQATSACIYNNIIYRNTSGGVYCTGWYGSDWMECYPNVINNTIVGNAGPAIYHTEYAFPYIYNNILAYNKEGWRKGSNTYSYKGKNIGYRNGAYDQYPREMTNAWEYTYIDPGLADPAHGDFHIQSDSPCKDGGDDTWGTKVGSIDIDEQLRIQGAHVDIGADESQGEMYPAHTAVVHVSPDGNNVNDGSTWLLAKHTIQAAIDSVSAQGGEVWVKAAKYNERLTLRTDVGVYGGFEGNETDRNQRDPAVNISILDANGTGNVVTADGYLIFSVLDGFTIQRGLYGIYCRYAVPTFANNVITANGNPSGGGIYCLSCAPIITDNSIFDNKSSANGAGLYLDNAGPVVFNNLIINNTAVTNGGGIYSASGYPDILNNRIAKNIAASGGGIYTTGGDPVIKNNIIFDNSSTSSAGGIYNYNGYPTIANNTIVSNKGSTGGGMYLYSTHAIVMNNIVALNSSGIYGSGFTPPNSTDFGHNCVYANTSYAYSGCPAAVGDITVDPQLASVLYGNFHIQASSPCRNAGDYVLTSYNDVNDVDIDGQERTSGIIDIGADESYGQTWNASSWIVRVSPDGNDANDGSNWQLAKRTVQAAIDTVSTQGGQIWVKSGIYHENIMLYTPYVYLYGGFAGTETTLNKRDWTANITVIDGNQNGSVVTVTALGQWNVLDGFTIRNGNGNISDGATYGGGIDCFYSSCGINNNLIVSNNAEYGAGISCNFAHPVILNNLLAENTAEYGGGIYCNATSGAQVVNNTFAENTASVHGAGICSIGGSSAKIANNIIAYNSSGIYTGQGVLTLKYNCLFENTSYNYSGIADPTGTNGNISADPLFISLQEQDYHIEDDSPCLNLGDSNSVSSQTDIDGQPRVMYGRVDIGFDEIVSAGDFESDGKVDWDDLNILAEQWLQPPGVPSADIAPLGGDGVVNFLDFALFAQYWLGEEMIYDPPQSSEITDGFETGNFSALPWVLTGNANWTIVSTGTYEGTYSAKSGTITHNQASTLEIAIDIADANTISFVRKVSSESGYDYLKFYIDGVEKNKWSGTADWAVQTFTFTPGQHTFKWSYTKDGSASSSSDCAWIDNLRIYQP